MSAEPGQGRRDSGAKRDPGSASADHRRTKIVATIGPATRSVEMMAELLRAGVDVFRFNFSHGSRSDHADNFAMAREASKLVGKQAGILGDLPGPKIRLWDVEGGMIDLETGSEVTLTTEQVLGTPERIPVSWDGLPDAVSEGGEIFMADGRIRLRVMSRNGTEVRCRVEVGGPIASHQGLNLPGARVALPAAGREDLDWVDFAVEQGVDLLAVSFVRRAEDVAPVERRVRTAGANVPVIAKIEKPEAAERAEEIVKAVDAGIMVARGDLGIELPIEQVPVVQRQLLASAGRYSRPSITATQMLLSMVDSPRPTRAEVSDVASAIQQGTDAVMLSEETAVGNHPIEAVRMMDRIARATEPELRYGDWLFNRVRNDSADVAASVARAAVGSTYTLGLKALVVPTRSGRTARLVSAHRPRVPVLAVSSRIETVRRLNLLFGVRCMVAEDWEGLRALLDDCARFAREEGVASSGDLIGITAGLPGQELGTNLFEVHRVP
ncbi:MAG TPA: pyruvate kinase [Solirubrobacterales bacterium]|nr:pyruvate kinase [Solirubrobacterales bacterium]